LLKENVEAVEEFKEWGREDVAVHFVSTKEREALAGFEHVLTNIPIFYDCTPEGIGRLASRMNQEKPCTFVGGAMEDSAAFQESDLTIQVFRGQQEMLLPADVSISNLKDLLPITTTARWLLALFFETIKQAIVLTLFAVWGGVYLDRRYANFFVASEYQWSLVATAAFVVVPALLRLAYIAPATRDRLPPPTAFLTRDFAGGLITCTVFSVLLVALITERGLCTRTSGLQLRGGSAALHCMDLYLLLSSSSATMTFAIFSEVGFSQKPLWMRTVVVVLWLGTLYWAAIPLYMIMYAAVGFAIVLAGKLAAHLLYSR
jgi:soluble P-type ATPase